jgi:hypothetical protein
MTPDFSLRQADPGLEVSVKHRMAQCGNQLTVGADTTCSFAENVRQKYDQEGPGTYEIYSPVTEKTYSMTCNSSTPVVCTGGNNAAVYFP